MEDKRYFFRVPIIGEHAVIINKSLLTEDKLEIRDLSALGISVYKDKFFKIGNRQKVDIEFVLEKKLYKRKAILVRREEKILAFKFIENKEKDNSDLSSVLFRLDAKRKK